MEKKIFINGKPTDYWIDSTGRMRNEKTQKYRTGTINKGYKYYSFSFCGKLYRFSAHRLVAEYFLPNPNNLSIVHHIDGNKMNNNVNNLEWVSSEDHAKEHIPEPRYVKKIAINGKNLDYKKLAQFRDSPYYASLDGKIYNLDTNRELRYEKSGEYFRIQLNYTLKGKHFQVHRVVWESFNGEIPKGYEIHHKDHNPANNALDNLEMLSRIDHTKTTPNKRSIKVYSVNINTGEEKHYDSIALASRDILGYRDGRVIPKAIKEKTIYKNCYWYYEE